jgi:dTDP-4-dehydrorhamnose reductase
MRVLLLGGYGQVGSFLRELLPGAIAPRRSELDLTDHARLRDAAREVDVVINCAAYNLVDRAEDEPELAMAVNRDAVALLGECSRFLVTFSTDYVFDGALERPYLEDDPPNPLSLYGRSKLEGERALGDNAIVLRTAWVFSREHKSFVSSMLAAARERDVVRVVDDQIGCPTHAGELARAVVAILAHPELRGLHGVYHLAGATAVSRYELARYAIASDPSCRARVEPVPSSTFPSRAVRPNRVVLDCSRAERAFGVRIPGFAEALDRPRER